MLERIEDLLDSEYPDLRTQLHLSKQDLRYTSPKIIDHKFLSAYPREDQIRFLSLAAYSTEMVRNIIIGFVKAECSRTGARNYFLRGSGATGYFPLDDFDVSFYGSSRDYKPQQWPQTIMDRPVSWGHVPREELANCLNTSLRMSASILEAIPITPTDQTIKQIINDAKEIISGEGRFHYLLFRQFEELRLELPWKKWKQPPDEYSGRKEMAGGKRTVQRITWSLQTLHPDLSQTVNPSVLLMRAYFKGLVPFEVLSSEFNIMTMIKSDSYEPSVFNQSTQEIHEWYTGSLMPDINKGLDDNIPPEYLTRIRTAFDPQTQGSDFGGIVKFAVDQDTSYKKWLMLWTMSHNRSCPDEILYNLWKDHLGNPAYRNVLRNLLRNPSFPIRLVSRKETKYDPHLLECYDSVLKKSAL